MKFLILAVFILVTFPASGAAAQREPLCPQDYLDKKAMNELVAAKTLPELEQRWDRLPAPDPVVTLVYAFRRSQLHSDKKSDDTLIAAILSDTLTFDLLYSLCYPKPEDVSDALADIAGGSWLNPALEAVLRQHHGYRKILMLPFVGRHNAEIGETIPCTVSELKDRAPQPYRKTLKELPQPARSLVCPDCC